MAGHFVLNIPLLWAGIVALASSSTTSPALTTHASTVTTANVTLSVPPQTFTHTSSDRPPNQTLSSPVPNVTSEVTASAPTPMTKMTAMTPATTETPKNTSQMSKQSTTTDATRNASTQPLPVPKCSYTLVPIQFGFQISIENVTNSLNCTLKDQKDGTTQTRIVNNASVIDRLKPCTNYSHNLSYVHVDGTRVYCEHAGSGNDTNPIAMTHSLKDTDFGNGQRNGDMVCYQTRWDIGDLVQIPKRQHQLCFIYTNSNICTDFITKVEYCNSSFNLSKSIGFDSQDINVKPVPGYPANLSTTLPPNCKNWNVTYYCLGKDSPHENKSLAELEPYTNYICTAQVTHENLTRTKNTDVWIDCYLQYNKTVKKTNTSINLLWSLSSSVCRNLTDFNFTYDCVHDGIRKDADYPNGLNVSCQFSRLVAYKNYTCGISVKYKDKNISSSKGHVETEVGIPKKPIIKSFIVKERNGIKLTFVKVDEFYGPEKRYIVHLYEGNTLMKIENKAENDVENEAKNLKIVVFKHLSYSTSYKVEVKSSNGILESEPSYDTVSTYYNEKALIGFLVFLIILTSVALIFVTYKIYVLRRERSRDFSESMNLIPKTNDEDRLIIVEPVTAESLLDTYKRKIADEGRLFLAEFQSIPRIFSKYTVKEAKKQHNVPKNRYVDILPYDYNRVQLTTGNGSAGCDYINASFIDGFKESKKYIAAQGPKEETVSDFWRMIWEQQTSIIVMVSRCEEGNRVKCAEYWPSPDRETEIFEEFIVKLVSKDRYPDYIIRHLSLTNKRDKGSEREVTHIQFMSWPDHGVPEEAHHLLKLRRRVNSFKNFFSGPIVIHCSAGVGRTGTYIGIDAMMESLEAEGKADIYGYVVMLRRQRCLMVQVEAQYILIHQALLEHTQFGETETSLQELHSTVNTLKQRSSDNESTLMEDEFDRLPRFKNWKTFNAGIAEENKKKNRTSSVIPYDYNRVLVKPDEHGDDDYENDDYEMSSEDDSEENAKYINASLISGYWGPHAFMLAQTPLPDTVADFCSMILQYRVPAVVMLSECSQTDEDCLYWGEDKKTFEDIEVELESTDNCPTFTLRTLLIHHVKTKARQKVKHFQFLKWGNGELPEKPQDLVDLIQEIKHRRGLTWPKSTPIVIHCNDGSSRSGVLCGLWNLLDSAKKEKTVDVFQVVKTLRKERQHMFSSLEQYQFLYDALEVSFPVQNGDVKAAQNSVQIVNETGAAEAPCSTTSTDQQEAVESADGDVSAATEESNSPTVTVEV